jgi:hypothetical protein
MDSLWPWLAVAWVGALHGLNPASGWMLAAAWGVRTPHRSQVLKALVPIALGHAASIGMVSVAFGFGLAMDRLTVQIIAGVLLVAAAVVHFIGCAPSMTRAPAGHAGLALWSFMMSTAHGAGLILLPALAPLCVVDAPAQALGASNLLMLALGAVAVHLAAMLAVTGLLASLTCRGFAAAARLRRKRTAELGTPVDTTLKIN